MVGTGVRDLGADEEAYRYDFIIKANRWRDDYRGLIRFAKAFGQTGAAFDAALESAIRPYAPDLVVMGGFLSLWHVPADWQGRVINVHPSLLPAFGGKGFYGERVHRAVLEAGVKVTGCTVHFVDDEFDHGPIVAQAAVVVEDDDTPPTLAHRVQEAERRLFPACIRLFAEGRLRIDGRRVRVLPPNDATNARPS